VRLSGNTATRWLHSALRRLADPGRAARMMQAMRSAGRASLVRVPWNDAASIMRALDVGASTVVVPMVDTAEDAHRAASACRFPPIGRRSR
jgi:4-hydroxy-2-oxoheptanedioate aldolase